MKAPVHSLLAVLFAQFCLVPTLMADPTILYSKAVPGRGTVSVEGSTEQGSYEVQVGNDAPQTVTGTLEITKLKFAAAGGGVSEHQLTKFSAGAFQPFIAMAAVDVFPLPQHTVFVCAVGLVPKIAIIDHQTTPAQIRVAEFPDDFLLEEPVTATVTPDPQQANTAIVSFGAGGPALSRRIFLLTGTISPL